MTCRTVRIGESVVVACTRGRGSAPKCSTPGCRRGAAYQCDARKDGGGTCDRFVCAICRVKIGAGVDYCAAHGRTAVREPAQGKLDLGLPRTVRPVRS